MKCPDCGSDDISVEFEIIIDVAEVQDNPDIDLRTAGIVFAECNNCEWYDPELSSSKTDFVDWLEKQEKEGNEHEDS